MTTSNSSDFFLTRDQIIRAALEETGELAQDETIDGTRLASCALRLNSWVKSLMAQGAKLWAMKQATLFLSVGTSTYSLGATGTHCTNSYIQTTLATDEATSSTSLSLTSTVGMAAGDYIGIVLNNGTIHWTTISGAPGAPTTIAIGLTSAATLGNAVFTYTTKINRPQRLDVDSSNWHSFAGNDTPVRIISREEYTRLTTKTSPGKIVQAYYDPQLINGILKVWPTPNNATDVLQFWYERILEDFDSGSNTPDFAPEWGEALILGLASRIAPSMGNAAMSLSEKTDLKNRADTELLIAMNYDRANVSTYFQPDIAP
jgi:hypothetical protein